MKKGNFSLPIFRGCRNEGPGQAARRREKRIPCHSSPSACEYFLRGFSDGVVVVVFGLCTGEILPVYPLSRLDLRKRLGRGGGGLEVFFVFGVGERVAEIIFVFRKRLNDSNAFPQPFFGFSF